MKKIELRSIGRFDLITFEPFADGSVNLTIKEPEKELYVLEAQPSDQGYEVKLFNRETGKMDDYFSLTIDVERNEKGVPSPLMVSRLFENCVYYLDGNHREGFANIKIDVGDRVVCDYCNEEFTDSDEEGGFLFGSYATCPRCAPRILKDAKQYGELNRITKTCPEGMSFANWVRTCLR